MMAASASKVSALSRARLGRDGSDAPMFKQILETALGHYLSVVSRRLCFPCERLVVSPPLPMGVSISFFRSPTASYFRFQLLATRGTCRFNRFCVSCLFCVSFLSCICCLCCPFFLSCLLCRDLARPLQLQSLCRSRDIFRGSIVPFCICSCVTLWRSRPAGVACWFAQPCSYFCCF